MATASIHSCLHVRPSPTWVLLAIWGLLSISMATAAAVQQSATSNEMEETALKHLKYGMKMLRETIGPNFVQREIRPMFTLAENTTCFAYDFYTHVSAMEAELCTCDPEYNNVSAIKYTTEKVVKNACYWMINDHTSNPAILNCSMNAVRDLCLYHKLQENDYNKELLDSHAAAYFKPGIFPSGGHIQRWLAATTRPLQGEPPRPVFNALLLMSQSRYDGPDAEFCPLASNTDCY